MIKTFATNDFYIEQMINSGEFKFESDGTIYTLRTTSGSLSVNKVWRKCNRIRKDKYQVVNFNNKKLGVHRVIYRVFIGELDPNLQINHIDGNPSNNNIYNLELVTPGQNQEHRFRVLKKPAIFGNCKISREIAELIRIDREFGMTYKELCEKYDLSKSTISYIVNKKTWK